MYVYTHVYIFVNLYVIYFHLYEYIYVYMCNIYIYTIIIYVIYVSLLMAHPDSDEKPPGFGPKTRDAPYGSPVVPAQTARVPQI